MANTPLIRNCLCIDQTVQEYYNNYSGDGPLYLLGRTVKHASNFVLQLNGRPLVIMADTYLGNGGAIDGSGGIFTGDGTFKRLPPVVAGGDGVNGGNASLHKVGNQWRPLSAGHPGTPGGNGSSGSPGTSVTLLCQTAAGIRINVAATPSAPGGNGGSGGMGGNGLPDRVDPATGETIEGFAGTPGGNGGRGGDGGNGANGGTLIVLSTQPLSSPSLAFGSTPGSPGGRGGRNGANGVNTPVNDDEDPRPAFASNGTNGVNGTSPDPQVAVLDPAIYVETMRNLLNSDPVWHLTNFWGPFRASVGEFYFRQYQPDDDSNQMGILAAREFEAALDLQSDNPDALRLRAQLLAGTNAIGLPRYLDVVPDFNRYTSTYNQLTALATQFFQAGVAQIIAAEQLDAVKALLVAQRMTAMDEVANADSDLASVQAQQKNDTDEVTYLQGQLDDTTNQINAAMASMQSQGLTVGGVLGTVAEVGAAVASVVAAIPTGGASLVALVPAVIALTDTVVKDGPAIAQAVFAGEKPDTDEVEKAYAKVGKQVEAVIAAGKTVVNFVKVVQKLTEATTPENAQSVALVKRGAELTHQLLVAKNQVALNDLRQKALQAHRDRAQALVDYINSADTLTPDRIREAGQQTVNAALAQANTLLTFAFLARRSFEIYTLPTAPSPSLMLIAGTGDPDRIRAYQDGLPNSEGAMVQAYQDAWNTLLNPVGLQKEYADYLQRTIQTDIARLEFTAESDGPLLQQFRSTGVLSFQLDVATISQGRRETKIRGVAVALVGATSPSSVISCDVWHGTRYEQIDSTGTLHPQFLEAKSYTVQAPVTPLALAPVSFGQDEPIDAPQALPLWGRGVGGDWNLRLPATQPHGEAIDLSTLHTVQVWIGYQFVANA